MDYRSLIMSVDAWRMMLSCNGDNVCGVYKYMINYMNIIILLLLLGLGRKLYNAGLQTPQADSEASSFHQLILPRGTVNAYANFALISALTTSQFSRPAGKQNTSNITTFHSRNSSEIETSVNDESYLRSGVR
jgi:hypothetical protein